MDSKFKRAKDLAGFHAPINAFRRKVDYNYEKL